MSRKTMNGHEPGEQTHSCSVRKKQTRPHLLYFLNKQNQNYTPAKTG